jgi:hypothetical protein
MWGHGGCRWVGSVIIYPRLSRSVHTKVAPDVPSNSRPLQLQDLGARDSFCVYGSGLAELQCLQGPARPGTNFTVRPYQKLPYPVTPLGVLLWTLELQLRTPIARGTLASGDPCGYLQGYLCDGADSRPDANHATSSACPVRSLYCGTPIFAAV